jgi:hypothetical protein
MIQKAKLLRLIASTFLSTTLCAQVASTTKRIVSFQGLKPSTTHCQLGLKAQFLDDTTLLISNPICAKGGRDSSYQHAIANLDGNIRSSIELSESSNSVYIGPPGYLFFPADQQGWLIYDTGLQPKWRVPIPSGEFPSSIALSPSRTAAALSSHAAGITPSTAGNSSPVSPSPGSENIPASCPFPG